jgi:hypothetical protein
MGEKASRARMWSLRQLVDQYAKLAGEFGRPLPLSQFELSAEEVSALFGPLDEDYHISRFLHFSKLAGDSYTIGAEDVTHLSIDKAIEEIL